MSAAKTLYDTDYEAWVATLLPEGTRIRHRQHPDLTGVIKHYEYNRQGISPIPYCVGWDDSSAAVEALGWFFVYPHPDSIEAIA